MLSCRISYHPVQMTEFYLNVMSFCQWETFFCLTYTFFILKSFRPFPTTLHGAKSVQYHIWIIKYRVNARMTSFNKKWFLYRMYSPIALPWIAIPQYTVISLYCILVSLLVPVIGPVHFPSLFNKFKCNSR